MRSSLHRFSTKTTGLIASGRLHTESIKTTSNVTVAKKKNFFFLTIYQNKSHFVSLLVCRDGEATSAIGTITPTGDVNVPSGGCWFVIEASADQRIEISCTAISSYLTVNSLLPITSDSFSVIYPVYHSVLDWWSHGIYKCLRTC
jgi:hypothetical protein